MTQPLKVPEHLAPFVIQQDPSLYTAMDHAAWRFIMRTSKEFFRTHAHTKYLRGLDETGISSERIPLIEEMDKKLSRFGWRAVGVSGFIPPAVFMEFQSLGFLPIACEMRTLEHLTYTPAPDIVHEAAGHAPILVDPEYARYLRAYGEVARKAIFSHHDMNVYLAVRDLSVIKEDPTSTPAERDAAQNRLDAAIANIDFVSEANCLARMFWWTVEYGLIQSEKGGADTQEPLIYGAGLLSSVGESRSCLNTNIQKIPFSLECMKTSYDITKPQPQLYVAKDFASLVDALEEYSKSMAFRQGGTLGLRKAQQATTVSTVEFNSGLQISGVVSQFEKDDRDQPVYLQMKGPTQLACKDRELEGQGVAQHPSGFGTPIGKIKVAGKSYSPSSASDRELGLEVGKSIKLEFESGVVVEGTYRRSMHSQDGKRLIMVFEPCQVQFHKDSQVHELFNPSWGIFDMGCGESVVSVFGGPADRPKYLRDTGALKPERRAQKTNLTADNRELNGLYQEIRQARETQAVSKQRLLEIAQVLRTRFPEDWLLSLEIFELTQDPTVEAQLKTLARKKPAFAECIDAGLKIAAGL